MNNKSNKEFNPNIRNNIFAHDVVPHVTAQMSVVDPHKKHNAKIDYLINTIDDILEP